MSLRTFHNILYFNVFRFFSFCFRWLGKPEYSALDLKSQRWQHENGSDELINDLVNSPKGDISLELSDRFIGLLYASVTLILWNLVSALLQLDVHSWRYGLFFWMVIAVVSIFVFSHEYLTDFRKFISWSEVETRKFARITLLTISGILLALIGSFVAYFSIAINNRR